MVECLQFFNGEAALEDLHAHLLRLSGGQDVSEIQDHLIETLQQSGFLDDAVYARLRDERHREFAAAPVREPAHAGSAYPEEADALEAVMDRYFAGSAAPSLPPSGGLIGIAAPHVSPEGGWRMYGAAYQALRRINPDRVFVILGTSHYGGPDRFGLTRKPYRTPYGDARTETDLVDRLAAAAPEAVIMEDYCHATEHSIEFQVVFLQHLFGADIRILPILCGSYAHSIYAGGAPEDSESVKRFLNALHELAEEEAGRLFWVLGVDLAHMGQRYGDRFSAVAGRGKMIEVAERDRGRIERITSGDIDGFWNLVRERQDDLKWCGVTPFYTLMRAVPNARGHLLGYEQWNIDPASVVTFGALAFSNPAGSTANQ